MENENGLPEERRNNVFVNEKGRAFLIKIFDQGDDSVAKALGALEIAKDIVKTEMSRWRHADAERNGLVIPKGRPQLHVQ